MRIRSRHFFMQAFCRLAAVFGATYFLGRPLEGVIVDPGEASVAGLHTNATHHEGLLLESFENDPLPGWFQLGFALKLPLEPS